MREEDDQLGGRSSSLIADVLSLWSSFWYNALSQDERG